MKYFSSEQKQGPTLDKKISRFIPLTFVVLFFIFTNILISKTANASLFSVIESIFESSSASAKTDPHTKVQNLQTIALLQAPNNVDPNPSTIMDIVPINNDTTLVTDLTIAHFEDETVNNGQISTYIVREGDTVTSVAKMFNVSINTITWANDLGSKSMLKVGQTLTILPVTGIKYTVKSGDTIKGIANKYKADIDEMLNYNDITITTPLKAGQSIIIPDGDLSPQDASGNKTVFSNRTVIGFIKPVAGYKSQSLHGHNGVDFAAPIGTKIVASAPGTVIISRTGGWNGGYGNYIVISHPNGTQTLYAHTSKNLISVGKYVAQGDTIALVGSTGKSTGPHLHFEVRGAKNPF